jgi:hypothetical protein
MSAEISGLLRSIEERLAGMDRRVLLSALQDGRPAAVVSSLLRSFNLKESPEIEEFFGWHNGLDPKADLKLGDIDFFPGFYPLSIEEAVANYQSFERDPRWRSGWFPIFANGGGDFYVVDLSFEDECPIRHFRLDEPECPIEYSSLESMLLTLSAAFDKSIIFVGGTPGYLEVDYDRFDELAARLNPDIPWWVR